jgi:tRNA(Ile)-lysidine synthase TilS/MesJ
MLLRNTRVFRANSGIQFNRIYMSKDVKKVVLAYSGGLDTSIILKWLHTTYGCEVVTFTADLGQGEERAPEGAAARHQAGEHFHRGPARGIRPRLCVSDVSRQCGV